MQDEVARAFQAVQQQYPAIEPFGFRVYGKQTPPAAQKERKDFRQLEFFHPQEPKNPYPGSPVVEVYNPSLRGKWLENAIIGDMSHYLNKAMPEMANAKKQFLAAMGPEQRSFLRGRYQHDVENYGEKRPFDTWLDLSFLDQMIGGYLWPSSEESARDWQQPGSYNPKQEYIMKYMLDLLQRKPEKRR